jgi:hypothetical protein
LENPDSAEHCDCGYDFASGSMRSSGELGVFDDDRPKEKQPTDYTGPVIVAMLLPVFVLFVYLGNADLGLTAMIVLGMIMCAVKVLGDYHPHTSASCSVVFYHSLAARKSPYHCIYIATRIRGFFYHARRARTCRKALLERFLLVARVGLIR